MARPPSYKTAEELQDSIDEYFEATRNEENPEPLTISGLCHWLGFSSRQSFYDLEKQDKFSYTIKRARLRIESFYESMLMSRSPAGAIFALKNFGWKDRQEIDYSGNVNIEPITWVKSENK